MTVSDKEETRTVTILPSPRVKMALARTGYGFVDAMLEIIDNSSDGIRKKRLMDPDFKGSIKVLCQGWRNSKARGKNRNIAIIDDGVGVDCSLDTNAIANVWALGGSKKSADGGDYGVFGMGLKGAVMAVAPAATFTSRGDPAQNFQTSVYDSKSSSFDVNIFKTDTLSEETQERKMAHHLHDSSGAIVVLHNLEAGPKTITDVYNILEAHLGRVYRGDLERGDFTITLGDRQPRTLDMNSGVDPLDGGPTTNWLHGGPLGEYEEVDYDGHKFRLRMSHTELHVRQGGEETPLGSGIKGSRKRGCYFTRRGREIAIETTEGKNLPWDSLANISNLFLQIDFDDDGTKAHPIQTDFGKKGVVVTDDFRRFLQKHIQHSIEVVKSSHSRNKKVSKQTEEVQSDVCEVFSKMISSPRQQSGSVSKSGSSTRSPAKAEKTSIKRQRYVGRTQEITLSNSGMQNSHMDIRHIEDYKCRDLPFWMEVQRRKGYWTVVFNDANSYVSEAMRKGQQEDLYKNATAFVLTLKATSLGEAECIEAVEHFGQLWNQYSETAEGLGQVAAV